MRFANVLLVGLVTFVSVARAEANTDLIVGEEQPQQLEERDAAVQAGTPLGSSARLFPIGQRINYVVGSGLSPSDSRISGAVREWESKTCFRFNRCSSESSCGRPYLRFVSGNGCSSPVGSTGSVNQISLGRGCGLGAAIHEIGHSLGLSHEQSRKDRNSYVRVDFNQVQRGTQNNFQTNPSSGRDLGRYDYGSIMHYSSNAFAVGRSPTITAPQSIGQRRGLSSWDIRGIEFMYNKCSTRFTRPRCMASVDESSTYSVSPSRSFRVEFNGLYSRNSQMSVGVQSSAPSNSVRWTGSSSIRDAGFVTAVFTPTSSMAGQTYSLSATFTAGGASQTCTVRVSVSGSSGGRPVPVPRPVPRPAPRPYTRPAPRPVTRPVTRPAPRPWWLR